MNRTKLEYLFRVEAPFVTLGKGEPERTKWIPQFFYSKPGMHACVRQLRGWKMRTTQDLMSELGAALQLFEGFGENWNALGECLSYMDEWLPAEAYILVVERAEEVLAVEGDLSAFLGTVDLAGNFWFEPVVDNDRFNRPPFPFHVLLNLSDDRAESRGRYLDAAAAVSVKVRID